MYVVTGYVVHDHWSGETSPLCKTREQCETMKKRFDWRRPEILTRYEWIPTRRKVVVSVQPKCPKKLTKEVFVALNRDGTQHIFDTRREAAEFFDVTVGAITAAVARRRFGYQKNTRNWYFYKKIVEVEDDSKI